MRLVVNVHQLPDRCVRIFLRGDKDCAEKLLDGAKSRRRQEVRAKAWRIECG